MKLSHRSGLWVLVACTLMWSIAGVVSRHFEAARGFEVTFWRSAFNAVALLLLLSAWRGPAALWRDLRSGGRALWLSGVCWASMFTAFMMALSFTTVANVLVTMSIGPFLTALLSRVVLGHRVPARTWGAIALAGGGIAWMYGHEVAGGDPRHLMGTVIALAVPVAAAVNWTLLQHLKGREDPPDMLAAVLLGAVISSLVTLPLALPFVATPRDLGLLGLLGVVQLAIPCLLAVIVARVLSAPEMSLMGLLEVIFGVLLAWLGAGEVPSAAVLGGGVLVLGALVANEVLGLRKAVRT
ncbi:MAG TPA: DMT family transporter [Rubrivivax sp.]|nr:DMT family transporter [Rubrivivax sp.]